MQKVNDLDHGNVSSKTARIYGHDSKESSPPRKKKKKSEQLEKSENHRHFRIKRYYVFPALLSTWNKYSLALFQNETSSTA